MEGAGGVEAKMMKCRLCSQPASVKLKGLLYCLIHFAQSDDIHLDARDKSGAKMSRDEAEVRKQEEELRNLWRDALEDVVLRMYDLQKEEQEKARTDPFAMMAMQAPRIDITTFKKAKRKRYDNSHRQQQQEGGREGEQESREEGRGFTTAMTVRKKNQASQGSSSSSSSSSSKAGTGRGGIMSRANQLWLINGSEGDSRLQRLEEVAAAQQEQGGAFLSSAMGAGPVCESCGSDETYMLQTGGFGSNVGKSETWGSKDLPEAIFRVTCSTCGFVSTVRE